MKSRRASVVHGADYASCIDESIGAQDLGNGLNAIRELLDSSRQMIAAQNFTGGKPIDEEATGISVKHYEAAAENSDDMPSPSFGDDNSRAQSMHVNALHEFVVAFQSHPDRYLEAARKLAPVLSSDDYRDPRASKNGGVELRDQVIIDKLRNALKYMIG